jgi:hypothetical protein
MAFEYFVDPSPSVGRPGEVHTSLKNPLGTERKAQDGSVYIYLQGVASTVDGDWVTYRAGEWTTTRLAASAKGSVAIATAAVVASNYGWYLIVGSDTAVCESSIVSNAACYAMGTAGRVDDAAVTGDQVHGARTTTAGAAGGTATVSINRPFIGSADAII